MKERVGVCARCGAEVFCCDGFLNGYVLEEGGVCCFDCAAAPQEEEPGRERE